MKLFAKDRAREQATERREAAERFEELRRSLGRLVKNADFRDFYRYLAYEFCGTHFGSRTLDAETQGVRIAMNRISEIVSVADGGPELVADAVSAHFRAVGRSIVRERTNNGEGK